MFSVVLGFTLFLAIPSNLWHSITPETQKIFFHEVSQKYMEVYHCKEARSIIIETPGNVEFQFSCAKQTI